MLGLVAWLGVMGPAGPDYQPAGVQVWDAHQFHVDATVAFDMYLLATRTRDRMRGVVWLNNEPAVYQEWCRESYWRLQCWSLLDDVLRFDLSDHEKLRKLDLLRQLLGDADYYGGRMPNPTPAYK